MAKWIFGDQARKKRNEIRVIWPPRDQSGNPGATHYTRA